MRIGLSIACRASSLGKQLVEIVDVPRPLDLGQHDDVELAPDCADYFDDVVQHPRRVERVDARPKTGLSEIDRLCHLDETRARSLLGIGGNRIFEIAEHHVDPA